MTNTMNIERQLHMYQSINKDLTAENQRLRQESAAKSVLINELNENLQAEREVSVQVKARFTKLMSDLSTGYVTIREIITSHSTQMAECTEFLHPTSTPSHQSSTSAEQRPMRSRSQPQSTNSTPIAGRQAVIGPRIKTPYGIVHQASIRLPRLEESQNISASALSPRPVVVNGSSTPPSQSSRSILSQFRPVRNLSARRSLDYEDSNVVEQERAVASTSPDCPEGAVSEVEAGHLPPQQEEIQQEPSNIEQQDIQHGLTPIAEVTEPTMTNSLVNSVESSESIGMRTPIVTHRRVYAPSSSSSGSPTLNLQESPNTSGSSGSDKENTLAGFNDSLAIANAPSSTPYTTLNNASRLQPKVVLKQLTTEELNRYNNVANVGANKTTSPSTSNYDQLLTPQASTSATTRKRKTPTVQHETRETGRPKRAKAPKQLAEPKCNVKLRRT